MIDRALPIDGWMEPHDLEWLAEHAATHRTIAEIGCWQGRSTMVLADNTPGTVHAIDHWKGSEEHQSMNWDDPEWCYKIFCSNLKDHIERFKVVPVHSPSLVAAKFFAEHGITFDMVFIDASHDYDNVKADILGWKPLCTHLLCGHDAGHPPIMQATHELLPNVRHEHSMWVVEL